MGSGKVYEVGFELGSPETQRHYMSVLPTRLSAPTALDFYATEMNDASSCVVIK